MSKERAIAEERSPDKGRSTNKRRLGKAWSTDEGRSTREARPSEAAAEPGAAEATKAANVCCTKVTATATEVTAAETATPDPREGRSRNQRGADHGRHGDRDQFLVNHMDDPPFVEASPLCVFYQLLNELNTDIPVTRITIADHDFPPRGRGSRLPACPAAHSEIAGPDFRNGSIASLRACARHFCFALNSGHIAT
jgi:hypothetical protein